MAGHSARKFEVYIAPESRRVLKALGVVAEFLEEIEEDMPWRPEAARAKRAAFYALRHLRVANRRVPEEEANP